MAETIYTKNAPDAIGPYSQAKVVGNLVFTSGHGREQAQQFYLKKGAEIYDTNFFRKNIV